MKEIHQVKNIWTSVWGAVLGVFLVIPACAFSQVTANYTPYAIVTIAGLGRNTGTNDGTDSSARFSGPAGIAMDAGSNIYVSDRGKDTIRKIAPVGSDWVVTTIAGRAAAAGSSD